MTTIREIQEQIRALPSMASLTPEKYAEEGGLAESFVLEIRGDLKPTQLRKVFHHIKDLQREIKQKPEAFNRAKLALIMPTLAYSVGRKLIPQEFYDLMKLCFGPEKCKTRADFESAANFLEAIMAYHKYHSTRKEN